MIPKVFDDVGDFAAYNKACEWCKDNGISYGSMQRNCPIGLIRGDVVISKWRNISPRDIEKLDGIMTGDKRNGPVEISIVEAPECLPAP